MNKSCGMLEFTWVDIMPHIHDYLKHQRGIWMYPIQMTMETTVKPPFVCKTSHPHCTKGAVALEEAEWETSMGHWEI